MCKKVFLLFCLSLISISSFADSDTLVDLNARINKLDEKQRASEVNRILSQLNQIESQKKKSQDISPVTKDSLPVPGQEAAPIPKDYSAPIPGGQPSIQNEILPSPKNTVSGPAENKPANNIYR